MTNDDPTRSSRHVSAQRVPGGVVHKLPADLRTKLIANPTALDAWKDITPLARNEFICWVEDAQQETKPGARNVGGCLTWHGNHWVSRHLIG